MRKTNRRRKHEKDAHHAAAKALEDPHYFLQTLMDTIEGQAFGKDFGVDPKTVIGKDDNYVFSAQTAAKLQANDQRIMAEKTPQNIEEATILNGKWVTYLNNKVYLIDDAGNVFGICGVGFDITHQKEMEEALNKMCMRPWKKR